MTQRIERQQPSGGLGLGGRGAGALFHLRGRASRVLLRRPDFVRQVVAVDGPVGLLEPEGDPDEDLVEVGERPPAIQARGVEAP